MSKGRTRDICLGTILKKAKRLTDSETSTMRKAKRKPDEVKNLVRTGSGGAHGDTLCCIMVSDFYIL